MGNFKVGLLSVGGCLNDWKLCLMTYLAAPYVFGMASEKSFEQGDGVRCLTLNLVPIVDMFVLPCWRSKIRQKKGIDGNFVFDCLAVYCCTLCAIYQGGVESGLVGHDEALSLVNLVTDAVSGFNPKEEAQKTVDDSKKAAEDSKKAAKEEMDRS